MTLVRRLADRARDMTTGERIGAALAAVAVIAVITLITTSGWNARAVTGEIVAKNYVAAHIISRPVCIESRCTTTIDHVPDQWTVTIAPHDGTSNVVRTVPENIWTTIQIGDPWADQ